MPFGEGEKKEGGGGGGGRRHSTMHIFPLPTENDMLTLAPYSTFNDNSNPAHGTKRVVKCQKP